MELTVQTDNLHFTADIPEDKAKEVFFSVVAVAKNAAKTTDTSETVNKPICNLHTKTEGAYNRTNIENGKRKEVAEESSAISDTGKAAGNNISENIFPRGFLFIKCPHCGVLFGMMNFYDVGSLKCKKCGGEIAVARKLNSIKAKCRNCEKTWRYKTNLTDKRFEMGCKQCHSPIDIVWNDKKQIYESL